MMKGLSNRRGGSTAAEAPRTSPTPAERSAGAADGETGNIRECLARTDEAHEAATSTTCLDAAAWLEQPDEADAPLVEGLVECGEFVALVGQSKAGKSLFALQAAVCVATGRDFLGRKCTRKRVYLANLEVSAKQYKKRLRKLCAALEITPEDLRGWLFVDNMRGESATWEKALALCKANGCEVAIIDPFYQIANIDENDQRECREAVDKMKPFTKQGIALFVVFHSPKGFSGDRQLIDMISGSAILARVPESVVGLLNHATEKTARVINAILRNYPPFDPFAVTLDDGVFKIAPDDIAPEVATGGRNGGGRAKTPDDKAGANRSKRERLEKAIADYFKGNPALSVEAFYTAIRETPAGADYGENALKNEIKALRYRGVLKKTDALEAKPDGTIGHPQKRYSMIGTPPRIEEYVAHFGTGTRR